MMEKRHYNNGEAEFMLDPVNDAVVKVTHRNQVGWIGISLDWDVQRPYTFTTKPSSNKRRWPRWPGIPVQHPRRGIEVPVHYVADPTEKGGLAAGESGRKKGSGEAGAPRIPE